MLDVKLLRNEYDRVAKALTDRNKPLDLIASFPELDSKRRAIMQEAEQLKSRRNTVSQEVAKLKKSGGDAEALIVEMREVGDRIKDLDEELRGLDEELDALLLAIPNMPSESVPVGGGEEDNVEIRRHGEPRELDFEPQPHWDLAEELGCWTSSAPAR